MKSNKPRGTAAGRAPAFDAKGSQSLENIYRAAPACVDTDESWQTFFV